MLHVVEKRKNQMFTAKEKERQTFRNPVERIYFKLG